MSHFTILSVSNNTGLCYSLKKKKMAETEYNYQFLVEPDNSLKCCICLEVASRPKQHGNSGCGKLFCEDCIAKNKEKPCPMCRASNPKYFEDVRSEFGGKVDRLIKRELLVFETVAFPCC